MSFASKRLGDDRRLLNASNNAPPIKSGEPSGAAVATLQLAFSDLGYRMPRSIKRVARPDGIFGQETTNTIMAFQRDNGLTADGVVGRMTLAALDAIYAARERAALDKFRRELPRSGPQGRFGTD